MTDWYHNDHLGTPLAMSDESGAVVAEWVRDPFGNVVSKTGTVDDNHMFPGQFWDEEAALAYNWNRWYSPEIGRYTQVDPLVAVGDVRVLAYSYAANNPNSFVDPDGLFSYNRPPPATKPLGGDALKMANCLEDCLGTSFVVTGGSECTPDGRHVPGGVRGSRHCTNQAFDVRKGGLDKTKTFCCAAKCGADGLIDEGTHWHFQKGGKKSGKPDACECKKAGVEL